jgi:NAD(P)-dependent dehydrogenase (short-subunit alcohol dehydrogenase family)
VTSSTLTGSPQDQTVLVVGRGGGIGTADDIAAAVMFALTSTFFTGQTLHVDGGEPLT